MTNIEETSCLAHQSSPHTKRESGPETHTTRTMNSRYKQDLSCNQNITFGSKISYLRAVDEAVWPVGCTRVVQTPFQPASVARWWCPKTILPEASFEPVNNRHGSILYRGVYYHSTNTTRPYVRLRNNRNLTLPIVSCCTKHDYVNFLKLFLNGDFSDHAITVHTPDHHVLTHK